MIIYRINACTPICFFIWKLGKTYPAMAEAMSFLPPGRHAMFDSGAPKKVPCVSCMYVTYVYIYIYTDTYV